MKANSSTETFHGVVKYASGYMGCVKWRSGSLIIEKDDEHGWHIKMKYNCSENSVLNLQLNKDTLKKYVCKDSVFIDVEKGKDLVSLYLKPEDKRAVKHIEELCLEVLKKKVNGAVNNSEVSITSTQTKSGLFTHIGNTPHVVKTENSPQSFTSVKSHKRQPMVEEGKENLIRSYSKPSEQFLQRSSEKSRQCLGTLSSSFYGKTATQPTYSSSTPKWLSKRAPGLMPDPSPNKRPRLSDSIPYSMKVKPVQPADTSSQQQQTLQGFSNLGNTCYMNAILQSLFGLETFSSDLMANKKMLRTFQQQSLCYALVKLLYVKRQATLSDILRREALRRVKSAISTTAKRFSGYGQHDAHEFLGQVLDQLKEEVIKVSKATPTPNKDNENGAENRLEDTPPCSGNNPITVNFEFEVLHTLTCLQCQEQVTKTEQFHDISLDVPKQKDLLTPRSLQDALSLFFKNEQIDYTCEKCGHGKSDVSHKITRLPRIFILHLKRYSYNHVFSKNTKMGQNVSVPTYITLKNHCTEETQPAFPPTLYDSSHQNNKYTTGLDDIKEDPASKRKLEYAGNNKYNTGLDDLKEDPASRRKLEYAGFQFKSKSTSKESETKQREDGNIFTETKEKRDEVDSVLTLEDEEDPDLSRAIEISLKEQEEKDQMCRDYGEDSESNFERVLELSRQEHKSEYLVTPEYSKIPLLRPPLGLSTTGLNYVPKARNVNQMTEEEQIQLAIQQSLMYADPYDRSNNTHSDDVIEKNDHMYTKNSDVEIIDDHSYTESFDIGPDGDNVDRFERKRMKTYRRRRHHSESDLKDKSSSDQELSMSENTKMKENRSKTTDSICVDMIDCNEMEDRRKSLGGGRIEDMDSDDIDGNQNSNTRTTPGRNRSSDWRNRLNNLSDCFSASDDDGGNDNLLCTEEMPEKFDFESDKTDAETKSAGKVYEIHDSEDSVEEEQSKEHKSGSKQDINGCISEKAAIKGNNDNMPLKNCSENETGEMETGQGSERKCQLTTNRGNRKETEVLRSVGVNEYVFLTDDDDDQWLSQIEDKENKVPEKPKLSDPSEFSMDVTERASEEVDAFVEESLDIPEINNEKGEMPYSYRLVSIVNHMGMSSSTGHYLSDVYDMRKKSWFSFDDSRVTKISETDVKTKRQRSGYIFFYLSKDIFDDLALQHAVEVTSKKS